MHILFDTWQKAFSTNLKAYMDKYDLTPYRLSKASGISAQSIRKYLAGELMPSTMNIVNLALIFKCDVSDLVSVDKTIIK